MSRIARITALATLIGLSLPGGVGCTPLQKGFQDGVSGGGDAALVALIETPITFLLEQALATEESGD